MSDATTRGRLPDIYLVNSLTRRRERLETIVPGRVSMYVCGMTVYDHCHLGHALSAVSFDMVRRYLEHRGFLVDYVVNFTDVDDKILKRAAAEGVDFMAISERYIASYFEDMDRLNVKRASLYPRATEHIAEILEMIGTLAAGDVAYPLEGDVYFDVKRFDGYGKLSGRKVEEMMAGARIEADTRRRQPADFALWKGAAPDEPGWESPWGRGRPGWHIECSAMASRYLGETFDIHGGGLDLIFPHHENEIAQSESASARAFARYWMHNGILNLGGEKMSKSIGNILGLKRLFEKHDPDALRHYLLGSHYRAPQNYEEGALDRAERAHERFRNVLERADRFLAQYAGEAVAAGERMDGNGEPPTSVRPEPSSSVRPEPVEGRAQGATKPSGPGSEPVRAELVEAQPSTTALSEAARAARLKFHELMSDDFNAAGAMGAIFELAGEMNSALQEAEGSGSGAETRAVAAARATLVELLGVLGFRTGQPGAAASASAGSDALAGQLIGLLVDLRLEARRARDYNLSDSIRDRLAVLGVELKDTPEGTTWNVRPCRS